MLSSLSGSRNSGSGGPQLEKRLAKLVTEVGWMVNRRPHANYRTGPSHLQPTHNWSRGLLVLGMDSHL